MWARPGTKRWGSRCKQDVGPTSTDLRLVKEVNSPESECRGCRQVRDSAWGSLCHLGHHGVGHRTPPAQLIRPGGEWPRNHQSMSWLVKRWRGPWKVWLWRTGALKANAFRTSLEVQRLGICLPMQETQAQSLVWKDPTCCGATKPECHNDWTHTQQLLKPMHLQPVLCNKRSRHGEKPVHRN